MPKKRASIVKKTPQAGAHEALFRTIARRGFKGLAFFFGLALCMAAGLWPASGEAQRSDAVSAATAAAAGGEDEASAPRKPLLTIALLDILINPLDAFTLRETVASLEKALPQYRWRTIALTTAEAYENIRAARPDFIFAPAGFSLQAQLERGLGSFRIATRRISFAKNASASVGAAFVVRKTDQRITDLASMRGLRAGASIPEAVDGWVAASGEIHAHGFDPEKFFSRIDFSNNAYPDVLSSLLARRIDVAVIPACLLETAAEMRLIDASQLRVVNEKNEGLACRHSTALYPDVSIHALATAPERAVRDVTVALLTLPHKGSNPSGAAGCAPAGAAPNPVNFSAPDYEWVTNVSDIALQQLQKTLRIGPYAYLRDMSPAALFMRYRTELMTAGLLLLFLLFNEWRLHRIVRKRTEALRLALAARVRSEKEAAEIRTRLAGLERRSIVQQMSGMIAHEINNPVGVVRNYAALLRLKLAIRRPAAEESGAREGAQERGSGGSQMTAASFSEADRRLIGSAVLAIDKEAVRISGIIARVRAYARSTTQAHAPCNLRTILAQSIAAYRAEADGRGTGACRIFFEEKGAPAVISGNPLELEILFLNLIRNGARAAVSSGRAAGSDERQAAHEKNAPFVSIRIESTVLTDEEEKRKSGAPHRGANVPTPAQARRAWLVRIENSGEALGEEAFEVLARLGDSVTVAPSGLGLGLTICRGIAESHAAELRFRRRDAGGVAAIAVFLAEPAEALRASENESADRENRGGKSGSRSGSSQARSSANSNP